MSNPSVGDVIADRYEIKGEPRRFPGYTGYRAFDREVEVEVALWWVHREMFPDPSERAKFLRAAHEVRAMKNDNARRLFDAAEIGDFLYATVQLATGERLQDQVARGETVSDEALLEYAAALCDALTRAHEAGLVHGRLVPEDVVTVSGLLKVGGIGLWHCAGGRARAVWGPSARYIAPEAWDSLRLGPKADVFSAGVILAELACAGGGELWTSTGKVRELKDELALARSDIAAELSEALEKDPLRRIASPAMLLSSLRAALGADDEPSTEKVSAIDIARGPTNGEAYKAPGPTAEIAAIDQEIEASEATAHYMRKVPAADPDDFPDAELIEPPAPDPTPPPRRVTPPPIPAVPPPIPARTPDARKTGDPLPIPLVAEPSKEYVLPPGPASVDPSTDEGARRAPSSSAAGRESGRPGALPNNDADAGDREAVPGSADPLTTPFNRPVPLPSATRGRARRKRAVWPYVAVAAVAAVGVAAIAWVALNGFFGEDTAETAPTPASPVAAAPPPVADARAEAPAVADKPVVVAPAPVAPTGPCPAGMVQVESWCIDAYESPGAGRLPETGMTYATAEKACTDRGARLCKPDEWERACRGPKGWSFPYGTSYRRSKCNTDKGGKAEIGAAGSFDCQSTEGAHDLSGNVAEWVEGGRPRGGAAPDGTDGRCSRKRKADKDRAYDDVGYRCCADAK